MAREKERGGKHNTGKLTSVKRFDPVTDSGNGIVHCTDKQGCSPIHCIGSDLCHLCIFLRPDGRLAAHRSHNEEACGTVGYLVFNMLPKSFFANASVRIQRRSHCRVKSRLDTFHF